MIRLKGKRIDRETRDWIRTPGDEQAAAAGMRFDGERGAFVIDWMHQYLRLYEGEFAGERFECRDWQRDVILRLFSWIRLDPEWSQVKGRETWIRRFNQAVVFIPKKNKKSPTLAAVGLYLTCGDGETGGKTFFFAKDGTQARDIAGKHAVEMLRQSPDLMSECSVNKVTFQITHEKSRSILRPESGGDARSQMSKEGLNGNILVDEVHVVDRRLMDRLSRAGISRMEPLQLEVSTSGNDPDSYGKSRYDYAQDVLSGRIEDPRLFVAIYEAPQDLTDKQLEADPVKWGKLANPAWGHTIREAEYLADYEQSKRGGASELANFKMYRLNIWQRSSNPLLDFDCWMRSERAYGLEDLRGCGGGLGLDLAKSEDMSAAVFVVPTADGWRQWPLLWITRDYAESNNHLAPFLDWGASGDLVLVDGYVIQNEDLLTPILEAIDVIGSTWLAYDATFAESLAAKIAELSKVTLAKFPQTLAAYSEPTIEYRNLVREERMEHPGNEVLTWQAGHVSAIERTGLIKPIKDEKQRHRKIDAIQAAIMGLFAARQEPAKKRSVYETRGPIVL